MYENLTLGQNGTTPKIATNSTPNPSLVASVSRISGGTMSTYADLDLWQMSTPKSKCLEEKPGEKGGKAEVELLYPVRELHKQNGAIKNTTPAPSDWKSSPEPSENSLVSIRDNQNNSKQAEDKVTSNAQFPSDGRDAEPHSGVWSGSRGGAEEGGEEEEAREAREEKKNCKNSHKWFPLSYDLIFHQIHVFLFINFINAVWTML